MNKYVADQTNKIEELQNEIQERKDQANSAVDISNKIFGTKLKELPKTVGAGAGKGIKPGSP